jgi:hypothetical protein
MVTLGGKKTLSEALELEAANIVPRTPSRAQHTMARTFWRNQSVPKVNEETANSLPADAVEAPATFKRTAPTNQMKNTIDFG